MSNNAIPVGLNCYCKKNQVVSPTAKLVGRCRNNRNPDKERDLTLKQSNVCMRARRKEKMEKHSCFGLRHAPKQHQKFAKKLKNPAI